MCINHVRGTPVTAAARSSSHLQPEEDVASESVKDRSRNVAMTMVDSNTRTSGMEWMVSHSCGGSCLGPLTFHCQAWGDKVSLSQGCRLATRAPSTFKDGLVFSSRPLAISERVLLKVVRSSSAWHGALRVGFTNVHPAARGVPLAPMAIPDLSEKPGHWAAAVPESCCMAGSELQFWVSSRGKMLLRVDRKKNLEILRGLDVSRPLWAMIDIYGQTHSIFLHGSEKQGMFGTKRSCPAPEGVADHHHSCLTLDRKSRPPKVPAHGDRTECVVCMEGEAALTLDCGHRCLCHSCADRIILEFGRCPLCRHVIGSPPEGPWRHW